MMRRGMLGLAVFGFLQAFGGYDVWFYPCWLDGVATSRTPIYITVEGDQYPGDYYTYTGGSTLTFHANVVTGHEVTMWSREVFNNGDITTALENGHFSEIVSTTSDTLTWTMPNKSQQLAVHMDWLKYDLAYDGNGETSGSATDLQDVIYTNRVTLAQNPFVKTGYTFDEWQMKEDESRTFEDGALVTGESFGLSYTNKSVTLVAQWTPNEYMVTLDANGGTFTGGATKQTRKVAFGQPYGDFPTDLARGGYTFENCWTNSAGRTIQSTDILSDASNHTLYAVWKSVGGISISTKRVYDDDGANGSVSDGGSWTWGSEHTLKATPSTGNHFSGWTKDDPNGKILSTDQDYDITVTEEATYYAHFALNEYTVVFKYKDSAGNDVSTNQVVKYGRAATPPVAPDYPHHTFNKWDSADYLSVKGDLTVNAVYVSTVLTVTFDSNGGDAVSPQQIAYDVGDTYAGMPTPTRTGYQWDEKWWTKTSGGDSVTASTKVTSTGTQTLYAHWTAKQYTLTLDLNYEDAPASSTKQVTYDSYYPSLPEGERTGYSFDGWWTGRESGEKVTSSTKVTTASDHTLYAHWTAKKYWVYLDAKGGSGAPSSMQVEYDSPWSGLSDPARDGYTFLGWYTAETGGDRIQNGERVQITRTTTLYAHWQAKTYTVSFDPNGGTVSETSRTVTYDAKYGEMPTPSRKGYDFSGWYTTSTTGGSRIEGDDTVKILTDTRLYARWTAHQFDVYFNSNGGTGSMSSMRFTWDIARQLTANDFLRTGYSFFGWGVSASSEKIYEDQQFVSNLTESASCQLFALWTPNAYTIRFGANGGTGVMADLSTHYGSAVTLPKNAFSNGDRAFTGWLSEDGKTLFGDGAAVSNLTSEAQGIVLLTAQWGNTYTIAYDGNGATNTVMAKKIVEANEDVKLDTNRYERAGYAFLGWATNKSEAAAYKVKYADVATVERGTVNVGSTLSLFAVWTNNLYRVRFYPNGGEGLPFERTFAYDVAQTLPGDATFSKEGQVLKGWTIDPTNAAYMAAGTSVSNLTAVAGATVAMFAKWEDDQPELSDLAKAADSNRNLTASPSGWCTVIEGDKGYPEGNDKCIELKPQEKEKNAVLTMLTKGTGTLTFYYKRNCSSAYKEYLDEYSDFSLKVDGVLKSFGTGLTGECGSWFKEEYCISNVATKIEWFAYSEGFSSGVNLLDYSVRLDGVVWIPDRATIGVTYRLNDGTTAPADIWSNATYAVGKPIGALPTLAGENFKGWSTNGLSSGKIDASWTVPATDTQLYALWESGENPEPVYPDDVPTIGGFESSTDGFSLSFTSDARFDYRLLSTSTLAPPDWQPDGEAKEGTGAELSFGISPGSDPAKFFKVEVLRRGTK